MTIGGYYSAWHRRLLGFVAAERNGVWDRAIEVPGLSKVTIDQVNSVSCASPGSAPPAGTTG